MQKNNRWKIWAVIVALILFAPNAVSGLTSSLVNQTNSSGRGLMCNVTTPHKK